MTMTMIKRNKIHVDHVLLATMNALLVSVFACVTFFTSLVPYGMEMALMVSTIAFFITLSICLTSYVLLFCVKIGDKDETRKIEDD